MSMAKVEGFFVGGGKEASLKLIVVMDASPVNKVKGTEL